MKNKLIPLIFPLIILIIWGFITSYADLIPSYLIPSPYEVLKAFIDLIYAGTLIPDFLSTLGRVLMGFLLAALVAIPLGILMGWYNTFNKFLSLTIEILRPIPPIAWIPFAILWFGVGLGSVIFIIFVGCFFPILINTMDGVRRTEPVLIESAYTLGASKFQTLQKVVIPAALPHTITGLKVGIGVGLMCTAAAEMIGSNDGLGYLILSSTSMLDSASAIVGMLAIAAIGIGFDIIFRRAERSINW